MTAISNNNWQKDSNDNDSEEDSDGGNNLKIVIDSPRRKSSPPKPTRTEQLIIENIEEELERRLEEKAAKTNLNSTHVKNIIKHVVTNEHVLALVRKAENPNDYEDIEPVFEPKLTRAKAKELLSTVPVPPVPWATPKPVASEVQVLFSEELQEDSSGDEYVPGEEEVEEFQSEDDPDTSGFTDPPSVPPSTPLTPSQCEDVAPTHWSEDGMFKIPPVKKKDEAEDEANIARRTRSKLCLSSTPLEVIEEAFVPPDITTDMYDMDCDNEDWMDFLKKFTRPLDEIARGTEDEELDPEYNILADEETDKVDKKELKEELREDKAVKVTKKELNNLMAELFEFAEACISEENDIDATNKGSNQVTYEVLENIPKMDPTDNSEIAGEENSDEDEDVTIAKSQLPLLEQQMRQHVQLLTQNFLLTYKFPELDEYSTQSKEYLLNLKFLCDGKERSMFYTVNLLKAIEIVEYWQSLFASGCEKVKETKLHVKNTMIQCIQHKGTGNQYIPSFPPLILETISKSDVFLYPSLLPKIPFKSPRHYSSKYNMFTESEDQLIAFGLEQFTPIAKQNRWNLTIRKQVKMHALAVLIQQYMMPSKDAQKIERHIYHNRRLVNNPIHYYYQNNKARPIVHYVTPLNELKILPPCQRQPEELPYQWKLFIYPNMNVQSTTADFSVIWVNVVKPQIYDPSLTATPLVFTPITSIPVSSTATASTPVLSVLTSAIASNVLTSAPIASNVLTSTPIASNIVTSAPIVSNVFSSPVTSTPIFAKKRKRRTYKKPHTNRSIQLIVNKHSRDPITKFVECLSRQSQVQKLLSLYSSLSDSSDGIDKSVNETIKVGEKYRSPVNSSPLVVENQKLILPKQTVPAEFNMLPSMPHLCTPLKASAHNEVSSSTGLNATTEKTTVGTSGTSKGEGRKSNFLEFSTISSTSFQQPDTSTEVEFCKSTDSFQTITTSNVVNVGASTSFENLPSSSCAQDAQPSTSTGDLQSDAVQEGREGSGGKDSQEDINALMIASSTVKPTTKKEPSGAEKKRAKLRREFLANLTVATPEDPEVEKQKNEMFALAYYDKMRETLKMEDYHKIMQILNDHEEGDAVDLYRKVEKVLRPNYQELADEFLLFLREKEAAAVNQLVPWIRMNNRSKFLRKLEIYFKDQPAQLRKIYKSLTDLSQTVDVSMEKVKSTLLPMFKGNAILTDLFLQNFMSERPPPSLLEGPYETIDITKEMSRPDDEEPFETITVPDEEDKYGGPSCICNCHQIEDPEFKSRYRHCIRCGTRFMNGKVYIQTGRGLRPATVSFPMSPNTDHNVRLMGKSSTTANQRKKRCDTSPSKVSPTKENVDEESEDDVDGKKKTKKKSPRKRKKQPDKAVKDSKDTQKTKKSPTAKCDSTKFSDSNSEQKEFKTGTRKRSYSIKKSKGKEEKKTDKCETGDEKSIVLEAVKLEDEKMEEEKRLTEDSMEWEDGAAIGESFADIKPNSPEQNTAESESEFCEESSQDNCESDSNSSISSSNNQSQSDSNMGEEGSWTREEDKVILETFQKENDKESAFKCISDNLKNRTVPQISKRFHTLMNLLLETLGNT